MAKTQKPTNPAESSTSVNNEDVSQQAGNAGGDDNSTPKKPSIEDIPEAQREYVNSLLAAARRDGEENGKKKATTEAEKLAEAERQKALKEQQEYQPLYEAEKTKAEQAEQRANAAERKLTAIEVALETKLPNPLEIYKRLQGENRDEMVEDAKSLLKVLKSDEDAKKADDEKAKKAANPPATSSGGDEDDVTPEVLEEDQKKFYGQRAHNTYNW